jgi:hypothetical protein
MFSRIAFTLQHKRTVQAVQLYLPGSVQIKHCPRVPTTGRDNKAKGVCLSPSSTNACAINGARL